MAIEIEPTPVVEGKAARRLTKILFSNRHKKTGPTPTPKLNLLTQKVLEFQEHQKQHHGTK